MTLFSSAISKNILKDRRGRTLTPAEIRHYCRTVTALQETLDRQRDIDRLYGEIDAL